MSDLQAALATIPDHAWTTPSDYSDNHVHHRYSRANLVVAGEWRSWAEAFRPTLADYDVHDAWLSRIQPGGYIVPHTDHSRWRMRWHIPIQSAGWMLANDENLTIDTGILCLNRFSPVGVPFQLKHWLPHEVQNNDDRDRIHLIIDTTEYVGPTESRPFVVL